MCHSYLRYIYIASKASRPDIGSKYPEPRPLRKTLAPVVEAM